MLSSLRNRVMMKNLVTRSNKTHLKIDISRNKGLVNDYNASNMNAATKKATNSKMWMSHV